MSKSRSICRVHGWMDRPTPPTYSMLAYRDLTQWINFFGAVCDATAKAGIGATLNRCRALAAKIANDPRNKRPEHFMDKLSLADVHASLERAADVLSTVKGSRARCFCARPRRRNRRDEDAGSRPIGGIRTRPRARWPLNVNLRLL